MTGIALFVYALLDYIDENLPGFSVAVKKLNNGGCANGK
jgi:hypothetical protein